MSDKIFFDRNILVSTSMRLQPVLPYPISIKIGTRRLGMVVVIFSWMMHNPAQSGQP